MVVSVVAYRPCDPGSIPDQTFSIEGGKVYWQTYLPCYVIKGKFMLIIRSFFRQCNELSSHQKHREVNNIYILFLLDVIKICEQSK